MASEITPDLVNAGRMKAQAAAERARQREAATKRASAKDITRNTIQAATLRGKTLSIEPGLKTDDLLRAAARHRMKDTDSRLEALTTLNHTLTHHCVVTPQCSLWRLPSACHTLFTLSWSGWGLHFGKPGESWVQNGGNNYVEGGVACYT